MKYLAIILSVYMTLLSLLPCQDKEDMIAGITHITLQKSHSPNDERGQETCTPFCTCSCCSTARYLTATVTTGIHVQQVVRDYPDYGIPAIQQQPIKIWQPPQIG